MLGLPEELQCKVAQATLSLSNQWCSQQSKRHQLDGERALLSLRSSSKQAATFGQAAASAAALQTMVFKQQFRWLEEDVHKAELLSRDDSDGYDSRVWNFDEVAAEADVRRLWERFEAVQEKAWSLDYCHPHMCGCGLPADVCCNSMFSPLQAVIGSLHAVEEHTVFMTCDHNRVCYYTREDILALYGPLSFASSSGSEEESEQESDQE